jgi:NADPH:quinone reductase-like Zn-dependent oxidoreductase
MWIIITVLILIAIVTTVYFSSKSESKLDFTGKHVLITGGSSGLGENMVYLFSKLGAYLTLASNQPEDVNCNLALVEESKSSMQRSKQSTNTIPRHFQPKRSSKSNQRTFR